MMGALWKENNLALVRCTATKLFSTQLHATRVDSLQDIVAVLSGCEDGRARDITRLRIRVPAAFSVLSACRTYLYIKPLSNTAPVLHGSCLQCDAGYAVADQGTPGQSQE